MDNFSRALKEYLDRKVQWTEKERDRYEAKVGEYKYVEMRIDGDDITVFLVEYNEVDPQVRKFTTLTSIDEIDKLIHLFAGNIIPITVEWLFEHGYKKTGMDGVVVKGYSKHFSDSQTRVEVVHENKNGKERFFATYSRFDPTTTIFQDSRYVYTIEDFNQFIQDCVDEKYRDITGDYLKTQGFIEIFNAFMKQESYEKVEEIVISGKPFREKITIQEINLLDRATYSLDGTGLNGSDHKYVKNVGELNAFIYDCKRKHREMAMRLVEDQKKDKPIWIDPPPRIDLDSFNKAINQVREQMLAIDWTRNKEIREFTLGDFINGAGPAAIESFRQGPIGSRLEPLQKPGMGRNSWSGKKQWREASGRNSNLGINLPHDE